MISCDGVVLRDAVESDIKKWFGKVPWTMRAQVAENAEGELIALWGVNPQQQAAMAFLQFKPEMQQHKRTCVMATRMCKELFKGHPIVVAKRDYSEPTSGAFLAHMGFKQLNDEGLYLWAPIR